MTCLWFEAQHSVELYYDTWFAFFVAVRLIVYSRAISQPLKLEPADFSLSSFVVKFSSFFDFAGHIWKQKTPFSLCPHSSLGATCHGDPLSGRAVLHLVPGLHEARTSSKPSLVPSRTLKRPFAPSNSWYVIPHQGFVALDDPHMMFWSVAIFLFP